MVWLADGLLLACMTKRGSLIILPRFGRPLKLITHGHSLDMGPAIFLPIHPLITVKGHRQSQHTDHSQSSEVDVLRQRFSVSAHPLHPVILCSDGYSFTILRLLTHVPLSQLVTGLILDSRKRLNLSPSSIHPFPEESFALRSSLNLRDVHDFAATLTDLEATSLDDTLGSTLLSSVAGGGGLFGSLEAGAVQFAGMDSDLEQTQSLLVTSSNLKKHSVEVATFQLRAALGLLLSCGKLEPGNGAYPQLQALEHNEVEKIQLEIQQAYRRYLSTLLTLMESSILSSQTEISSGANMNNHLEHLFHELFDDVLGLIPLDSFSQSHLELVTALINGGLLIVLRSSMQKHKDFATLSQNQPTIQLLKKFADSVCEDISIVSELLESAMSVLNTTYGMRPLSSADTTFHAPLHTSKRYQRRHHSSGLASHLSLSLTNMLEILGAFWQDIQACGDIANATISGINSNTPQHTRLQLRELGVLCKGLASSLQSAMTALKASHAQIRRLIRAGKKKGVQLQLEVSQPAPEQGENGNPITSLTNENLSLLLSKLKEYDLKSALELIHSDNILVLSSSSTIADAPFNLNASIATLSGTISHTHLSLATPSARPVVACLAKVMMAFFSNQKLLIPPSAVAKLTGSTIQGDICTKRLIELKRSDVLLAIRDQELSKVWTADCALELALIGGLWEEATKFVANLGEWKKAILLSLAYLNHTKLLCEKAVNVHVAPCDCLESLTNFAHRLALENVIDLLSLEVSGNKVAPLGFGKGQPSYASTCNPHHCTEESFHLVTGTLQVCAAGGMDSILTKLVASLIRAVTSRCQLLPLTVHSSVYLPAPPLYCPQPTIPEEEYIQCPDEYGARYTLSHLVHSLVLVLRASNCLHSCAQWYSSELHKLTKASGRTREAFALPGKKMKGLPRTLGNLANSGQNMITNKDGLSSPVVRILLACFRQLCGLLWFLHTRDQASAHLRKLQPSLSKPVRDSDTVQMAALWCCRLLPFAELLTQNSGTKTPVDVQLTALSAISELPNGAFFASLLALYFPSLTLNDRSLNAKFQRLMSRLRSTQDPTSEQLLSVIYQTKSQKVLQQCDFVFGESNGHFQPLVSFQNREEKLFEHDFKKFELHSQAFNVGCFIFEYDVDYLNFLDTLFAVTLQSESYKPTTSKLMLSTTSLSRSMLAHTDQPDLTKSPLISERIKLITSFDSSPCWQHLLPLLHMLKEWSEIPQPQLRQQKSRQSEGKLKSKKDRGVSAAMRVNVPLELVVNCLRQEEERIAATLRNEQASSQLGGGDDVKEHTSSSLASVTSCILSSSASNNDQTMKFEELEGKGETELKDLRTYQTLPLHTEGPNTTAEEEPDTVQDTAATLGTTSGSRKDYTDGRIQGASVSGGSFPLLQVPEGVLQGKLSHEAVQCALMASPSRQSKPHQPGTSNKKEPYPNSASRGGGRKEKRLERSTLKETREEAAAVVGGGDIETRGSSMVDLELSDSISTGEFPSDVTFSIGEVGSRLRPGDDTLHTTLGTETLQLLLTGNTGDALSKLPTATPQASSIINGIDSENKEKPSPETVNVELEEVDIGHNHSTSTLVNEDSILTPTRSSSSVTALTLTEISQIEGTQSTVQLKVDERAHVDKPQNEVPATIEATNQFFADDKAGGSGDSEEGVVDGGGVKGEEKRDVEHSVESSQELGKTSVDNQQSQGGPDTNLVIGDIVRSEMRKILEVQHKQLLSLLDGAATSASLPTLLASQQKDATVQSQAPSLVETHCEEPQHVPSDDSMPPILNVDDLRSLTPSEPSTDKASHVSIAIPPPPTAHDRKQQPCRCHSSTSSIRSAQIGAELKVKAASTPAKPRKSSSDFHGVKGGRQKSFRLSDLDTSSECYDHPGHNHVLSSSETSDYDRVDGLYGGGKMSKKRQKFEQKVKKKSSGIFTHTQQFGKHGGIQLLHLEHFDRDTGHTGRDGGQLDQEFPGLAKALKQFNNSVAPRYGHFASSESKLQPAATIKNMPLLQLPNVPDQAPPLAPPTLHAPNQAPPITPPIQQPPLQQARHQNSTVGGSIPIPLLIIPNQPQPFSAHPVSAGGSNIPLPDSAHLPTTVSHLTSKSSYLTSVPGPINTVGRHTTFKSSVIHSSPHPTPSGGAQLSKNDNFKLPQVPIRPFVPILLPPPPSHIPNRGGQTDHTSHDPTSARPRDPQLLQLNDPLSRMKREGFKLLKEDPRDEKVPELKLLHLEHGPIMITSETSAGEESKTNLPTVKTEQTSKQPKITVGVKQSEFHVSSSAGSLTTITSTTEESSEMLPHHHHWDKGKRQGRVERRQRGRRGKGVAWKMDQKETEKPQDLGTDATSPKIDGDVYVASGKDEVDYSQKVAPSDERTKSKSERRPLIGHSSRKTHSFPDEIPLQRLELRRLDMNASFIPNSSPQGEENIHVHTALTKVTDSQSDDVTPKQRSSPVRFSVPKTSEIGIQVDRMAVPSTFKEEGEERKKLASSSSTSDQATYTEPIAKATVSSAIQVSPEHFSGKDGEEKVINASEHSRSVDSVEVTSVSSLDSEEVKVQLSDSDDDDDNDGGLPSTEQQDEFTPPPLWYNSRSPIPIPTKTEETNSPIPEDEEAPPTAPSHFAGFSATPPPPLPVPLSPVNVDNQQNSSPRSHSQSPVPKPIHQQHLSIQRIAVAGESRPHQLRSDVMERLQQLEEQLNAIESTARNVEGEFKTTNQILFTIDRLQAVSDTLTAVTGGSHGDGDVGLLHHGHYQAEISPPPEAASSPTPPYDGDVKLEDIADKSQKTKALDPGPSQEAESEFKSRRVRGEGPHHHQDAKYLEGKDTKVPERAGHHTDRESGQSSLKMAEGGRGGRERGREELRSWMAAKRKERLVQFLAERDRLRKREKHPFQLPASSKTGNYSVRGQKPALLKREQEKEFVAKRIEDAYTLMKDILTSKPSPSHSSTTSSSPPPSGRLPPKGRGRGGARDQQRKQVASGTQKKVAFSTSTGVMKRSQSDSRLYREKEEGENGLISNEVFGSTSSLYVKTPAVLPADWQKGYDSSSNELDVDNDRSRDTDLKHTQTGLSSKYGVKSPTLVNNKCSQRTSTIRKISSVDGLTEDEQDKIAAILASTDYDGQSVSSGSIVSNIDWEEVDKILDS